MMQASSGIAMIETEFMKMRDTSALMIFQALDITFHRSAKAIVRLPDRRE